MSREYAIALGARLRAVRREQGLTQQQVHQRSGNRWSTVVLGSYERADRAISVTTLADLAAFYGVPTEDLLPTEPAPAPPPRAGRKLTIDLRRIPALPARLSGPLARYTTAIRRHSDGGAALPIRDQDLPTLAVIYDTDPHTLTETLTHWGVLAHDTPNTGRQPKNPTTGHLPSQHGERRPGAAARNVSPLSCADTTVTSSNRAFRHLTAALAIRFRRPGQGSPG